VIVRFLTATAFAASLFWLPCIDPARAADIDGVWASEAAACSKIYTRTEAGLAFARDADMYGSGFIIDGKRIKGKMATCTIKLRKRDGRTVHLIAVCSTDIAVDTIQFSLNVIDDNRITRIYPGVPELETPYERCPP
jgi:hypothetical protein